MSAHRVILAASFFFSIAVLAAEAASAADFRVENTVFVEGESLPQSQGVTIFHEGLVYDFLNKPAEVIVFDKPHQRFLLLDPGRRLQSGISTDEVQTFVDRARKNLSGHRNPNIRWLADPSFDESFDNASLELTLKSTSLTYQARVQATDATMAAQYREFSDWYAKLNHTLNPKSSWPPFARIMLNEAIRRRQGVPKEVHLTATLNPKEAAIKVTSRHQLAAELNPADTKRIAAVRRYLESFKKRFPAGIQGEIRMKDEG